VTDKGWRVDIRKHVLRTVIDEIITSYDTVPECVAEPECQDCAKWKYFEGNEPNYSGLD
jgi:lipase ATG15